LVIKGWGSWSPVTNWQRLIAGNNIILIAIVKGIFKCKKYIFTNVIDYVGYVFAFLLRKMVVGLFCCDF
ncbi:MAG: hypothetical protein LBQ66_14390, partial [Planctomycetaceae bacterium]|jgi:hypothetical protein|nr:hypothetical protein [Planctomycetaceae bacterium]